MLLEISKREYIIEEHTKVTDNFDGLMEQSGPRLRTVWGMSVARVRRRLNQISSVLEALSFRRIDAHHACIAEKQASKRDLALTMSLVESLMYSCISSA